MQQVAPEGVVVAEGLRQPVQGGEKALPLPPEPPDALDDGRWIELSQQGRAAGAGELLQLGDGGAGGLDEVTQPPPAQPRSVGQGAPAR